jgi:hypothetical protein
MVSGEMVSFGWSLGIALSFGSTWRSSLQCLVEPNIDVVASLQESPPWRQTKERQRFGAPDFKMRDVEWHKKIGRLAELLAAPYVPARRVAPCW